MKRIYKCMFCGKESTEEENGKPLPCDCLKNKKENKNDNTKKSSTS